ncbi:conserved hypothetical protein [Talaromyces stipitatus ATCC 10500]|uniref:Rhodopsin domain-containing protein n=1 Tax=Talaromyces stipitatus (strain ATCC 10500 / CBS 375.48 / QM 6759 / NRRL 1006) TaxID=441959 RepID=B8MIC0_TALSN|nr:uncharacterized protein TSTA_040830 [Talaromyces stipitatus ATCC 10500]EED14604.1 conserved hypothetical protein [Talaromyces stipitatus ATCC 10500]
MDTPWAGEDVTPNNYAAIVQVITWMLMAISGLALLIRLMTRFFLTKRFAWDDVLIIVAFGFSVCEDVTYLVSAGQAWGQVFANDFPAESLMPALKISIPAGILLISPIKWHRVALQVLGGFIVMWMVTSVFALTFQCPLPDPWNYITKTCPSRVSFITNWLLQMLMPDRISVRFCFM